MKKKKEEKNLEENILQDEKIEIKEPSEQASEIPCSEKAMQSKKNEDLKEKLEEVSLEKEKNYANYLRALADQENLRKRFSKEKEDLIKYNSENIFKDLLPVLDSIEKALEETNKSEDEKAQLTALQNGFDLIGKKLLQTLEKNGLKSIVAKNAIYDPNLHQAIQTEKSSDIKEAKVKDELMKGYELNGRLIRPSMVSVLLPDETKED